MARRYLDVQLILVLLICFFLLFPVIGPYAQRPVGGRLSELVKFHISSTRIESEGVDGWDSFVVGRVNRTTTIISRLENAGETPMVDIEVTCTAYWYDGFYPDRGAVMFKDVILVDVPPGDGSLSEPFEFQWVPSFAGSYMLNISAHVPGDAREMSTEPLFFQGVRYEPIPGSYFYSGVWVATEYWNGSHMEGWETFSTNASEDQGWGSVIHPYSSYGSRYHSTPYCFWAGNRTTWNISGTGVHSLVSPPMDLSRFDPEPYDVERSIRRPQIFFLYRYRGELTPNSTDGKGRLYHYISTDNGTTWDPLLDIKDDIVNVSGSTPGSVWSYSKRPAYVGEEDMVGIDLGAYQGKEIRIRFDLNLSGMEETGILLDDISLMGMDLVVDRPFDMESLTEPEPVVSPGSDLQFDIRIHPKRTIEDFKVRLQCVDASGLIDPGTDISIHPEVMEFSRDSIDPVDARVNVDIPENERSGNAWIVVRGIGGGMAHEVRFDFEIEPRHNLVSSVEFDNELPSGSREVGLSIANSGNIMETAEFVFLSSDGLQWSLRRGERTMDPGEAVSIVSVLSPSDNSTAGQGEALIVVSRIQLPSEEEMIDSIGEGEPSPAWRIHRINYTVEQYFSLDIEALTRYREIGDPPTNGSMDVTYPIFIMNNGNGLDSVDLTMDGMDDSTGMSVILPERTLMEPGSSRIVDVVIRLNFPVPMGRYSFNLTAQDSNNNTQGTRQLVLVLGSKPIASGTFFLQGSMAFEPKDVIRGMETIISFTAQTFGFPAGDMFTVGLFVDNLEVASFNFPYFLEDDNDLQISWRFESDGIHNVTLVIYPEKGDEFPGQGLLKRMNATVEVKFIDLYVSDLSISGMGPLNPDEEIEPGEYSVEAVVWNTGNTEANIATVNLEIIEMGSSENLTFQSVNITDIGIGRENVIQFKSVKLDSEKIYRITVSIDNKDKWYENEENDVVSMTASVGEEPPEEPVWKETWFLIAGLALAFITSLLLFLYLMRKKL